MIFRRARFDDVIDRQLEMFERDHEELAVDAIERLAAYNAAEADEAEELYGDYVDVIETGSEILDSYARTLAEGIDAEYEGAFNRAVAKRLPPFALSIENR